jgi:hypothetical protein
VGLDELEALSHTAAGDPRLCVGRIPQLGIGGQPREVRGTVHRGALHANRPSHGSLAIVGPSERTLVPWEMTDLHDAMVS